MVMKEYITNNLPAVIMTGTLTMLVLAITLILLTVYYSKRKPTKVPIPFFIVAGLMFVVIAAGLSLKVIL